MYNFYAKNIYDSGVFCILPVLSGLYKETNKKMNLILENNIASDRELKKIFQHQECINKVYDVEKYKKECCIVNNLNTHNCEKERPYYTQNFKNQLNDLISEKFDVDDNFKLKILDDEEESNDEMFVIYDSIRRIEEVFKKDKIQINYEDCSFQILSSIFKSSLPLYTSSLKIAILANLANKETIYMHDDWEFDIMSNYRRFFYTDRNTELVNIKDIK